MQLPPYKAYFIRTKFGLIRLYRTENLLSKKMTFVGEPIEQLAAFSSDTPDVVHIEEWTITHDDPPGMQEWHEIGEMRVLHSRDFTLSDVKWDQVYGRRQLWEKGIHVGVETHVVLDMHEKGPSEQELYCEISIGEIEEILHGREQAIIPLKRNWVGWGMRDWLLGGRLQSGEYTSPC